MYIWELTPVEEVVKKEIIKLLEVGIVYPLSDYH